MATDEESIKFVPLNLRFCFFWCRDTVAATCVRLSRCQEIRKLNVIRGQQQGGGLDLQVFAVSEELFDDADSAFDGVLTTSILAHNQLEEPPMESNMPNVYNGQTQNETNALVRQIYY